MMKIIVHLSLRLAGLVLFLLSAGCFSLGGDASTTNVVWTFDRNLVTVDATVGGRAGTFLVGTASEQTILDSDFGGAISRRGRTGVHLGERYSATVTPARADLGGIADGVLGGDAWRGRSLTIDYQRGLLVLGKGLDPVTEDVRFRFRGTPSVRVTIDGAEVTALVDTASPEAIVLPARTWGAEGRRTVTLRIGKTSFEEVDALVAPVGEARLGNRLLAHFLVTVDYPRGEVSLWRHGPAPKPN
ncbi:MAG TPA: hypothetical protein VGF40_18095 [Thermoanaerobaculia bacterium]